MRAAVIDSPEQARRRAWWANNRERVNAIRRSRPKTENAVQKQRRIAAEWYRHNERRQREKAFLRKYGITVAAYDALYEQQHGVCASCGLPETHVEPRSRKVQRLSVDHDHVTGQVRGLLCTACNRALGLLREDANRIRALAVYIEAHR